MSATEFKFLNQNAEKITLSIGVVMIAFGLFVSVTSDSKSLTSFIPSCLGLVLFILGFLSLRFTRKKSLFMHLAVIVGLLTFIGGLDIFRSLLGDGLLKTNFWADISKLFLLVAGGFHLFICIQSFRYIRKQNVEY